MTSQPSANINFPHVTQTSTKSLSPFLSALGAASGTSYRGVSQLSHPLPHQGLEEYQLPHLYVCRMVPGKKGGGGSMACQGEWEGPLPEHWETPNLAYTL